MLFSWVSLPKFTRTMHVFFKVKSVLAWAFHLILKFAKKVQVHNFMYTKVKEVKIDWYIFLPVFYLNESLLAKLSGNLLPYVKQTYSVHVYVYL